MHFELHLSTVLLLILFLALGGPWSLSPAAYGTRISVHCRAHTCTQGAIWKIMLGTFVTWGTPVRLIGIFGKQKKYYKNHIKCKNKFLIIQRITLLENNLWLGNSSAINGFMLPVRGGMQLSGLNFCACDQKVTT